ncbi:MAG TPA: lipoprotein [Burkholderiaceae bacterium]|nr:lipoprotein [Burkholderiaceae bacterium]HQR76225.1 lipoprotein [Burkholderiaceae bacterium]
MSTAKSRILVFAAFAALAGCGQKGPLTLPPAPAASQSKPPAERPAERPANRPFPDVPATNESQ